MDILIAGERREVLSHAEAVLVREGFHPYRDSTDATRVMQRTPKSFIRQLLRVAYYVTLTATQEDAEHTRLTVQSRNEPKLAEQMGRRVMEVLQGTPATTMNEAD